MKCTGEIDAQGTLPGLCIDFEEGLIGDHAGIGDEHIELPETSGHSGESPVHLRAIRDVGLVKQHFGAAVRREPGMLPSCREIEQRHACAFRQQAIGGRAADIAETSGDGHDLPVQSIQGCPRMLPRPRFRRVVTSNILPLWMIS